MEKLIYIIRHGETECNLNGIVQGCGIDSELNQNGLHQSKLFYEQYQHEKFDLIFSSHLKRSIQTVQEFISKCIPHIQDKRIREISWGEHEGKSGEPELMEKYFQILKHWGAGNYHARPIDGESAEELKHRIELFLEELTQRPESKILVCTHGRTLRAMMCIIQKLPISRMEDIQQRNTGLYKCRYSHGNWELLETNNLTHIHSMAKSYV